MTFTAKTWSTGHSCQVSSISQPCPNSSLLVDSSVSCRLGSTTLRAPRLGVAPCSQGSIPFASMNTDIHVPQWWHVYPGSSAGFAQISAYACRQSLSVTVLHSIVCGADPPAQGWRRLCVCEPCGKLRGHFDCPVRLVMLAPLPSLAERGGKRPPSTAQFMTGCACAFFHFTEQMMQMVHGRRGSIQ